MPDNVKDNISDRIQENITNNLLDTIGGIEGIMYRTIKCGIETNEIRKHTL